MLALVAVGCGAPPTKLTALPHKQISLVVDFNVPPPMTNTPPGVLAILEYQNFASSCPTLAITAALDGVMLTPSPNLSGSTGDGCALGFGLTTAPPPDAPQSTVQFADASGSASYTVAALLDARMFATTTSAGSIVHVGDALTFEWPVASDALVDPSADFDSGMTMEPAPASLDGTTATVASLACDVDQCANAITSTTRLPLTIN